MIRGVATRGAQVHIIQEAKVIMIRGVATRGVQVHIIQEAGVPYKAIAAGAEGLVTNLAFEIVLNIYHFTNR